MNNIEISALINHHPNMRIPFGGVYAVNTLPKTPEMRRPLIYIVNTAPSFTKGDHWTCIYFGVDDIPEFFDSYGFSPKLEFELFMGKPYRKNITQLQGFFSTVCGQYCMFYLYMRYICHMRMDDILGFLLQKGSKQADEYVNRFIEQAFRTDQDVVNTSFLIDRL